MQKYLTLPRLMALLRLTLGTQDLNKHSNEITLKIGLKKAGKEVITLGRKSKIYLRLL